MSKQILAPLLPMLALMLAPAYSALASEPAQGESMTVRAAMQAGADEPEAMRSRTCLSATGSRIRRAGQECMHRGRAYSRQDLERTGAMDLDDMLQRLDPSITRGR